MMRSYQEWAGEPIFSEIVAETIVESWTGGSSRNWQRIAMLFGFSREALVPTSSSSWGQFLGRGSGNASRKGNEVLDTMEKALSGEVPLDNLIKLAGNNSPFRLCFNEAQSLKQKLTGKPLDAEETKWLLNVLENFYTNGHINPGQLKMLWHSITGTPPNDSAPKGNPKAIDWDVHSPIHLLNQFRQHGGNGIFSFPSNNQNIKDLSERIIRTYYPDHAAKLLGQYDSPAPAPAPTPKKKGGAPTPPPGGGGGGGGGSPPPPVIDNPADLAAALGKVDASKMDPKTQNLIKQLLSSLGGGTP